MTAQEKAPHHQKSAVNYQVRSNEVVTLLTWQAPGRPFQKHNKIFYVNILLLMLFIETILFLFSQYTLMMVVLSLIFVVFVLATVPPTNFRYRISSEGITIEDHFFLWQELYDFYFKKRYNVDILHIRTKSMIPGELTLTLGEISKEHIKSILLSYLPYREIIKQTFVEKSGDWLSHKFPMENSTKQTKEKNSSQSPAVAS